MASEGIPGTPRTVFWIGNYNNGAGWSQCSSGASNSHTNWTVWNNQRGTIVEPQAHLPCALFSGGTDGDPKGWYSRDCLHWYHCMCESGTGTSAAYSAWIASNRATWMAPWVAKGTWTFVVAAAIGILPLLVSLAIAMLRPSAPGDWKNRVKARVTFVMLHTGWLLLCFGFTPVIAFFTGQHAVYAIGYPQIYAAFVPLGVCCWLLAIDPTSSQATYRSLLGGVVFFAFFTLVGLFAVYLWGIPPGTWIAGLIMGAVFALGGIVLGVAAVRTLRTTRDARTRYRLLWVCMRLFFVQLFLVSLALFLEYTLNLSSQFSENIGWVLLGVSSLLCALLTTPKMRANFCVWLSGVSHKVGDKKDALNAAMLIWVPNPADITADGGTAMATTA